MKSLSISQVDAVFANGSYTIEFLLYFKNTIPTKRVLSALAKVAADFWPLFGTYQAGKIHSAEFEEAACFEERIVPEAFDASAAIETILNEYKDIHSSAMTRLFRVTVIQFTNGTVIIPSLRHLAGDGYSYFYFLATWAALSRSHLMPLKVHLIRPFYKPNYHRTILKKFHFPETNLPTPPSQNDATVQCQEIPGEEVRNAVHAINADAGQQISANDFLSAVFLKKAVQVRAGHFSDRVSLTMPIDVRKQIPHYGPKFLGNGIMFHTATFRKQTVETATVAELAIAIREARPTITRESYLFFLERIEAVIQNREFQDLRPFDPDTGCLVTNLSRMPADTLNFGAGTPDLIFPLTIEKNAAAILSKDNVYQVRMAF
ncbi:MAG: acyltransferase [Candidatus Zhuqueibacterota bacterium]